jgi:hypothetical protein
MVAVRRLESPAFRRGEYQVSSIRGMSKFSGSPSDFFDLGILQIQIHLSSVSGRGRNRFASGKLLGARQTTAPPATRDLPTTLRTKSRFTVSLTVPSTSLQIVPGDRPYLPQSPLRGFGRARKRRRLYALRGVRGPEVGRRQMSPRTI